mmetsp:Transcript_44663/g.115561  ORF Transcript_44663/g.115561 Transcript_44663/m.115561 type:complete len:402 (+) Transcript_44663:121-1326(+)
MPHRLLRRRRLLGLQRCPDTVIKLADEVCHGLEGRWPAPCGVARCCRRTRGGLRPREGGAELGHAAAHLPQCASRSVRHLVAAHGRQPRRPRRAPHWRRPRGRGHRPRTQPRVVRAWRDLTAGLLKALPLRSLGGVVEVGVELREVLQYERLALWGVAHRVLHLAGATAGLLGNSGSDEVATHKAEQEGRAFAAWPVAHDWLSHVGERDNSNLPAADADGEGGLPQGRRQGVREDRLHARSHGDVGSYLTRNVPRLLHVVLRHLDLIALPIHARPAVAGWPHAASGGAAGPRALGRWQAMQLRHQLEAYSPGQLIEGLVAGSAAHVALRLLGRVPHRIPLAPATDEHAAALQAALQVPEALCPSSVALGEHHLHLPEGELLLGPAGAHRLGPAGESATTMQ